MEIAAAILYKEGDTLYLAYFISIFLCLL